MKIYCSRNNLTIENFIGRDVWVICRHLANYCYIKPLYLIDDGDSIIVRKIDLFGINGRTREYSKYCIPIIKDSSTEYDSQLLVKLIHVVHPIEILTDEEMIEKAIQDDEDEYRDDYED